MDFKMCKMCTKLDYNGIDLLGIHICKECEDDIINIDINDIKYEYYKTVIKHIWIEYLASIN